MPRKESSTSVVVKSIAIVFRSASRTFIHVMDPFLFLPFHPEKYCPQRVIVVATTELLTIGQIICWVNMEEGRARIYPQFRTLY